MQKVISKTQAKKIVKNLKAQGKKTIFTNGCFDILHPGHVLYLEKAKKLGDILIIGLNSDKPIQKNKGKSRPIVPLKDRAIILSALYFVDYIVVFDEETPIKLLATIQPDIQVKGGDYKPQDMPEYETVKKYGGKIKILPFIKGKSTTDIIQRILSLHKIK